MILYIQKEEFAINASLSDNEQYINIDIYNTYEVEFVQASSKKSNTPHIHIKLNITNLLLDEKILIFPNPFKESADLIFSNEFLKTGESYALNIYDIGGRLVKEIPVNESNKKILRESLENGLYIYKLINNSGEIIDKGKFVIE